MAFDAYLADRIREVVVEQRDVTEKRMFGGLAFLWCGKMFVGIVRDELMLRLGPERATLALALPHVRPMDFTGKPMKNYVFVAPEGVDREADLHAWVREALAFVQASARAQTHGR